MLEERGSVLARISAGFQVLNKCLLGWLSTDEHEYQQLFALFHVVLSSLMYNSQYLLRVMVLLGGN